MPAISPDYRRKTTYLKDVKANNTAAQSLTAGSYQTRVLNTVEGNSDIVSLSSNQFTLQAGTYEIEASVPVTSNTNVSVDAHKAKIRNITDSTDVSLGYSLGARGPAGVIVSNSSEIKARLTITSSKIFEIQQRVGTSTATGGLAANFGDNEVYTIVKITKVR